jgi:hypothetical protein
LILDGFDVVDKGEYPAEDKLVAGAVDGYDAVMMTGSRECKDRKEDDPLLT